MQYGAFEDCPSVASLLIQPANSNGNDNAEEMCMHYNDSAACPCGACGVRNSTSEASRFAIVKAFNNQSQFSAVCKIWATDDVVVELKGLFAAHAKFADVPRALRAAPDAKTWAGVQLWLWWLPPSSFVVDINGTADDTDGRAVCKSRVAIIWTTMLSAYKASEVLDLLPDLEPELWELFFRFLKHDELPAFQFLSREAITHLPSRRVESNAFNL